MWGLFADWCAALARMWDDRAYYDRLAAAARAAAAAARRFGAHTRELRGARRRWSEIVY